MRVASLLAPAVSVAAPYFAGVYAYNGLYAADLLRGIAWGVLALWAPFFPFSIPAVIAQNIRDSYKLGQPWRKRLGLMFWLLSRRSGWRLETVSQLVGWLAAVAVMAVLY